MGVMTGEMKIAKSLYLKGLAPSDGRDGALSVNTRSLFGNKAPLLFNNVRLMLAIVRIKCRN